MNSPLTPLDFLERSRFVWRDKIAVSSGTSHFTYSEYDNRVRCLASALAVRGAGKGDRVAVLAPNTIMALEVHFAVPMIGAVLVMLNTRLTGSELAWIINHCGAKILLVDPRLQAVIAPHLDELPGVECVIYDYEELLQSATPLGARMEPDEQDMICINYTSGTTGFPKGVMFSHRGAALNAISELSEHGLNESSVYLWTLPLFHCNGWCFSWAVTAAGGRNILLDQFDPQVVAEIISRERVTHLCGAPIVIGALTNYCMSNGIHFTHGLKIVTAGAPPSPAVIRAAEAIGADVAHVYGLTETYGPHTICAWRADWNELPLEQRADRKARQGVSYLICGQATRVVDEQMNDVPPDGQTMGEVIMRGNNVMIGYYASPEATAEAFRGGWFHSGDLAVMHADGYIEIRDRGKDIIISGGENISSVEVEKTIYNHPAVLEAAVVAVPDEKWGEVPKAFVTLKDGAAATAEDIIAYCREHMAHFKCPKHVAFGPLPKTATGKIRKNELRAEGWEGHQKRVN